MHEAEKMKLVTAALMAGQYLEKLSRAKSLDSFINIYKKHITGLTASIMCFDALTYNSIVRLYAEFKDCYDFDLSICKSRLLEAKKVILENENNPFDAETVAIAKEINFE